jgi:hypothetical protein
MRRILITAGCVLLLLPQLAKAWGEKGHLMVNRLAIDAAAGNLPPFMKSATEQLVYNGYEPDRWREEAGTAMNIAQAADHFFDSELWGQISTIPWDRYAFMSALGGKKVELVKVGYLPYAILENYGRLRNAFRQWRNAQTPQNRAAAEANAIVYAGILGHYAADSTMPMHLTVHYNGWAEGYPNPDNFTMDRMFHGRYENAYVNAAIAIEQVRPRMRGPKRLPSVFEALKTHLTQTFDEVRPIYRMEKAGEFNPESPRPAGTNLISDELARASIFLEDLWYTAWMESGERPVVP